MEPALETEQPTPFVPRQGQVGVKWRVADKLSGHAALVKAAVAPSSVIRAHWHNGRQLCAQGAFVGERGSATSLDSIFGAQMKGVNCKRVSIFSGGAAVAVVVLLCGAIWLGVAQAQARSAQPFKCCGCTVRPR